MTPYLHRALVVAGVVTLALHASARGVGAQQIAYAANAPMELDSITRAALVREVGRARTRGIPVEPLVAKAREGQIKRADPSRIRSALAALAVRLDSARSALGSNANDAELVAGADALAAGADGSALRALRSASAGRDLAAPLGALAQLVATGVPTKRATSMMLELLRRNAAPGALLTFGNLVESDVAVGVPAEESALFRLRAIEAAMLGDKVTAGSPAMSGLGDYPATKGSGSTPRRKP